MLRHDLRLRATRAGSVHQSHADDGTNREHLARRALGATKWHILRYFMVENWLITTLGCVLGCALAIAIGMRMSEMYQLPRLPLFYLAAGVLGTWLLGLVSVLLPARRAASISPAVATRSV